MNLRYVEFRGRVRAAIAELYPAYKTGQTWRYFTSAVVNELCLNGFSYIGNPEAYASADVQDYLAWKYNASNCNSQPTEQKETTMLKTNTKLFKKIVMINGIDASTMSDDEIFGVIATVEAQIRDLDSIDTKPSKLGKKIEKMHKDLAKIRAYVDNR